MHRIRSCVEDAYLRLAVHPRLTLFCLLFACGMSEPASAQSCGGVFSFSGFTNLLGSVAGFLTGNFGRAAVIIAICIFGALMLFGELKGVFGTGIKILFGGSLILAATQWAGLFTSFGGGTSACSYITNGGI